VYGRLRPGLEQNRTPPVICKGSEHVSDVRAAPAAGRTRVGDTAGGHLLPRSAGTGRPRSPYSTAASCCGLLIRNGRPAMRCASACGTPRSPSMMCCGCLPLLTLLMQSISYTTKQRGVLRMHAHAVLRTEHLQGSAAPLQVRRMGRQHARLERCGHTPLTSDDRWKAFFRVLGFAGNSCT